MVSAFPVVNPLTGWVESNARSRVSAHQAWESFEQLLAFTTIFVSTASQLALIFQSSRLNNGGPLFCLLCVVKPLLASRLRQSLWGQREQHPCNSSYFLT